MKKLTLISTSLLLIMTTAFADINEKQINAYLEASGAKVMFDNLQQQIGDMVEQQSQQTDEKIDPMSLVTIRDVMTRDENFAKFTSHIKRLDASDYKNIMAYYATELGKKSAKVAENSDMEAMEKELPAFMAKLKENPPSEKRMNLIKVIVEVMNMDELQTKMLKEMFASMNEAMPSKMKMPEEEIEKLVKSLEPMLDQQIEVSTLFSYRDFSDKELEEIGNYAKTKSGKAEMNILFSGLIDYMSAVMGQMFQELLNQEKAK